MAIFSTFFLKQYRPKKCLLWYSRSQNAFLGYKTKKFKKSKNWHLSNGVNPLFGSKNGHFLTIFLGNIGLKNVFYDILKTKKKPLYAIKTTSSKTRKVDIYRKGLIHGFGPNMAIFSTFLFRQYRPEKCLLWYSRTKKRLSKG